MYFFILMSKKKVKQWKHKGKLHLLIGEANNFFVDNNV